MSNQQARTANTPLQQHERRAIAKMRIYLPQLDLATTTSNSLGNLLDADIAASNSECGARFSDKEASTILNAMKCCNLLGASITCDLADASMEVSS